MNTPTAIGLNLVRQALVRYSDTPSDQIQLDTVLADIQVDSLTLAELLFELEDRLNTTIADATEVPKLVSDVVTLILPYLDNAAFQNAA